MRNLLLSFATSLLCATAAQASATYQPVAPSDTVAGHTHLVAKISKTMCIQLANDHVTVVEKMTQPEVLKFTEHLFTLALQADSVTVLAMMAEGAKRAMSPQEIGRLLGKDAIIQLSRDCPAALPLIMRIGQTDQAKQAAAAALPPVTEAEKKVLQPLATAICAKLTAANAKAPLLTRPPAERQAVFVELTQRELKASRPQLLRYYSAAQLADKQALEGIVQKVCSLMVTHSSCAGYLTLLGTAE